MTIQTQNIPGIPQLFPCSVWITGKVLHFSPMFLICRKVHRLKVSTVMFREAWQQQSKLHSRAAGWLLQLARWAEFLNDTSVITSAVLAGQLHPDMLYLVDFTRKTASCSARCFASQSLTVPGCVKVRKYLAHGKPWNPCVKIRSWGLVIFRASSPQTCHQLIFAHCSLRPVLIWTMKIDTVRKHLFARLCLPPVGALSRSYTSCILQ